VCIASGFNREGLTRSKRERRDFLYHRESGEQQIKAENSAPRSEEVVERGSDILSLRMTVPQDDAPTSGQQ
jgi:hypothetical protein